MTKNDIDVIGSAFLTTEEVMAILRVNIRTIYRLIRAREIPAVRVGRAIPTQRPRGLARGRDRSIA